ncbi:MAG: hypothetical protein E7655_01945 [Ruminococcaceae bacterium]|nr:hypothetical protein [Oscillospiraceae bacterium]
MRGRGVRYASAAVLFLVLTAVILILPCQAESDLFSDEEINALIPEEVRDRLGDGYDSQKPVFDGADAFFDAVGEQVSALFPSLTAAFASLFGFLLLSSALSALRKEIVSPSLARLQEMLSVVCLTALLYGRIDPLLQSVLSFLETVTVFVSSLLPYMTLLTASGGNAVTAASQSAGLLLALTLVENLCIYALSPLIKVSLTLAIADSFSPLLDLSPVLSLIKKVYSFLLASAMSLLSIVLLFQNALSLSADNAAARGMKFAGSFVPVVGSSLGDAVRTVLSGLSVVKGTLGYLGLAVVFLLVLPVFLSLVLQKLALMTAKTAADVMGMKEEGSAIGRFGDILSLMLAAVCSAAVIFVIAFALFVSMTYAAA